MIDPVEIRQLSSDTLHHLAYLAEQREQASRGWHRLSETSKAELLGMLERGLKPALGWWRQRLPFGRHWVADGWPLPIPPTTP